MATSMNHTEWDKGLFGTELVKQSIFPRKSPPDAHDVPAPIATGTYLGTKKAVTEMFYRIEERFRSFFDVANFEPSVPQDISFEARKKLYTFQAAGSDPYPPHLSIIPLDDQVGILDIFNLMNLLDTGALLPRIIPQSFLDFFYDHPESTTLAKIEERNRILRRNKENIYAEPNIGDRADWYTDAVFAQQQFTGNNPTSIRKASDLWMQRFRTGAEAQGKDKVLQVLNNTAIDEWYIQDCSYFRDAIGVAANATMKSDDGTRFGCASVTLFRLYTNGKLHPLAIILDFKTSLADSVLIFNQRLSPSASKHTEATDWPWRYAKMCAQVADWLRHEVAVHLVNCHFVEEVTIVAAHRAFPTNHAVYRLLQPHWLKTLSLNAAARSTLVPQVVIPIVGVTEDQLYTFTRDAYKRFDWSALYIPTDLASRGFQLDRLPKDSQFKNYAYGRDMILMWNALHTFVSSVLKLDYSTDEKVATDPAIAAWCSEMKKDGAGGLKSFPDIKTVDALIDTVTMCIHIASPQHTAVNYLQEYYQSFLPNKPASLCAPLPQTLSQLNAIKEPDIVAALPVKRPREWLLATHVPHLLSMRVAEEQNLLNYAVSLRKLSGLSGDTEVAKAATKLCDDLVELIDVFKKNSNDLDDKVTPYEVMNPVVTAVSILA